MSVLGVNIKFTNVLMCLRRLGRVCAIITKFSYICTVTKEQNTILKLCKLRPDYEVEIAAAVGRTEKTVAMILRGVAVADGGKYNYKDETVAKVWAEAERIAKEQQELISAINWG